MISLFNKILKYRLGIKQQVEFVIATTVAVLFLFSDNKLNWPKKLPFSKSLNLFPSLDIVTLPLNNI